MAWRRRLIVLGMCLGTACGDGAPATPASDDAGVQDTGADVPAALDTTGPKPVECGGVTCALGQACLSESCVDVPGPGDLVITEIFYDADGEDPGYEWFEVANTTNKELALGGVTVSDDQGQSFVIANNIFLGPSRFGVIGQSIGAVPGGATASWGGQAVFELQNTRGQIVLTRAGAEIDRVAYDEDAGWPKANGSSIALDPTKTDGQNDEPSGWCLGEETFEVIQADGTAKTGLGSPAKANPSCYVDCDLIDCPKPPAQCADAQVLVTYSGEGICKPTQGGCDYSNVEAFVDCVAFLGTPTAVCSGAACMDPATDGVDLTGMNVKMYQNGDTWSAVKFTVHLVGFYPHGSYVLITRNALPGAGWEAAFSPALTTTATEAIFAAHSSEDTWLMNGDDDPIIIYDSDGFPVDSGNPIKSSIHRRQADGTWAKDLLGQTQGAVGAPESVAGVTSPIYVYEIGEAHTSIQLTDFNGNYALLYVP